MLPRPTAGGGLSSSALNGLVGHFEQSSGKCLGSLAQAAVLTAEGSHYNVAGIVLSMLTRCNGSPALHCAAGKQFTGSDTDFKVTAGMHRSFIQA